MKGVKSVFGFGSGKTRAQKEAEVFHKIVELLPEHNAKDFFSWSLKDYPFEDSAVKEYLSGAETAILPNSNSYNFLRQNVAAVTAQACEGSAKEKPAICQEMLNYLNEKSVRARSAESQNQALSRVTAASMNPLSKQRTPKAPTHAIKPNQKVDYEAQANRAIAAGNLDALLNALAGQVMENQLPKAPSGSVSRLNGQKEVKPLPYVDCEAATKKALERRDLSAENLAQVLKKISDIDKRQKKEFSYSSSKEIDKLLNTLAPVPTGPISLKQGGGRSKS